MRTARPRPRHDDDSSSNGDFEETQIQMISDHALAVSMSREISRARYPTRTSFSTRPARVARVSPVASPNHCGDAASVLPRRRLRRLRPAAAATTELVDSDDDDIYVKCQHQGPTMTAVLHLSDKDEEESDDGERNWRGSVSPSSLEDNGTGADDDDDDDLFATDDTDDEKDDVVVPMREKSMPRPNRKRLRRLASTSENQATPPEATTSSAHGDSPAESSEESDEEVALDLRKLLSSESNGAISTSLGPLALAVTPTEAVELVRMCYATAPTEEAPSVGCLLTVGEGAEHSVHDMATLLHEALMERTEVELSFNCRPQKRKRVHREDLPKVALARAVYNCIRHAKDGFDDAVEVLSCVSTAEDESSTVAPPPVEKKSRRISLRRTGTGKWTQAASKPNLSPATALSILATNDLGWGKEEQHNGDQTFLRRLLSPLAIRTVPAPSAAVMPECVTRQSDGPGQIRVATFSLLDVLLRIADLQPAVLEAVLCRMAGEMKNSSGSPLVDLICASLERLTSAGSDAVVDKPALCECVQGALFACGGSGFLQRRLLECLGNAGPSVQDRILNAPTSALQCKGAFTHWEDLHDDQEDSIQQPIVETKSCPTGVREANDAVLVERQKLLKEFREREKPRESSLAIRKTKKIVRNYDGAMLITGEEMAFDAFVEKTVLMNRVNATFLRPVFPRVSRPRLQGLPFTEDSIKMLRDLLFDEDGSLSDRLRNDIDRSTRNDPRFISFRNRACRVKRTDKRWQVPLKKHALGGTLVQTRTIIDELFHKNGILDLRHERLDEIGLLFGGTEDQSLHHDVARQTTSWMLERPELADDDAIANSKNLPSVAGWEIDRLRYNDAMASAYAPSSIIMGIGGRAALLGVQRDQIERIGNNLCKIRGGREGEVFEIVRENEHLAVLRIKTGAMFTGDFPHAGVRNVRAGTADDELLTRFNDSIEYIISQFPSEGCNQQRTKALIDMMCQFPGLDRLCRLHCSTEMLHADISIPANTVGFSDCWANRPDRRCVQEDHDDGMDEEYESDNDGQECDCAIVDGEDDGGKSNGDCAEAHALGWSMSEMSTNPHAQPPQQQQSLLRTNRIGNCEEDADEGEHEFDEDLEDMF